MKWFLSAIGAIFRLFGARKSEKPFTPGLGQPPTASSQGTPPELNSTPPVVKPSISVYPLDEVAKLPRLSFNAYTLLAKPLAKFIESDTGIFWMIPLLQSAHESNCGNSELARKGLNLFGIKASESWGKKATIKFMSAEDPEMKHLSMVEWRKYGSWLESFKDWGALMQKPAYAEVLPLMRQGVPKIEDAFRALGKVYAADKSYAEKLINIYRSIA